jgi:hypothetical protein
LIFQEILDLEQLEYTAEIPEEHVEVQKLCPHEVAIEGIRLGEHTQENNYEREGSCLGDDEGNDEIDQIPSSENFVRMFEVTVHVV